MVAERLGETRRPFEPDLDYTSEGNALVSNRTFFWCGFFVLLSST